jgi:hypothetical protein
VNKSIQTTLTRLFQHDVGVLDNPNLPFSSTHHQHHQAQEPTVAKKTESKQASKASRQTDDMMNTFSQADNLWIIATEESQ